MDNYIELDDALKAYDKCFKYEHERCHECPLKNKPRCITKLTRSLHDHLTRLVKENESLEEENERLLEEARLNDMDDRFDD